MGKKNLAYEVSVEEGKRIIIQPAVSKEFLEDCKQTAQKYRKK